MMVLSSWLQSHCESSPGSFDDDNDADNDDDNKP